MYFHSILPLFMRLLLPWTFFLPLSNNELLIPLKILLNCYLLCEICLIYPSLRTSCIYFWEWSHIIFIYLAPKLDGDFHEVETLYFTAYITSYVNTFSPSFPQPTRQIHVVPKGQDIPSKTLLYSSGYDRPCDYNRHPSQLWHGIWDIPMKRNYKVGVNATLGCITTTEEKPVLDLVYF